MSPNLIIKMCRGSIFTSTITYNPDTWEKFQTIFPGYMPVTHAPSTIDFQGNTIQIGNQMWTLSSKKDKVDINFLDGKIDIILQECNLPYSKDNIDSLCKKIETIFSNIVNQLGLTSNRLAFAPLLISEDQPSVSIAFARRIFGNRKFKGEQIDNCDFSNVFRIKEKINDSDVIINHLVNFALVQAPFVLNGRLSTNNILQVNLDINTLAGQQYIFSPNAVTEFYKEVSQWTIDFIDSYFNDK